MEAEEIAEAGLCPYCGVPFQNRVYYCPRCCAHVGPTDFVPGEGKLNVLVHSGYKDHLKKLSELDGFVPPDTFVEIALETWFTGGFAEEWKTVVKTRGVALVGYELPSETDCIAGSDTVPQGFSWMEVFLPRARLQQIHRLVEELGLPTADPVVDAAIGTACRFNPEDIY